MKKTIRIGNAGGYWGYDPGALKRQIEGRGLLIKIRVLGGDARDRGRRPAAGTGTAAGAERLALARFGLGYDDYYRDDPLGIRVDLGDPAKTACEADPRTSTRSILQIGQSPGPSWMTSGCIGQVWIRAAPTVPPAPLRSCSPFKTGRIAAEASPDPRAKLCKTPSIVR